MLIHNEDTLHETLEITVICDVMLQSDKHVYMGYLIPTISMLRTKLEKRRERLDLCCRPLVNVLLAGIGNRFAGAMQCKKTIAAATPHPTYKADWTGRQRNA